MNKVKLLTQKLKKMKRNLVNNQNKQVAIKVIDANILKIPTANADGIFNLSFTRSDPVTIPKEFFSFGALNLQAVFNEATFKDGLFKAVQADAISAVPYTTLTIAGITGYEITEIKIQNLFVEEIVMYKRSISNTIVENTNALSEFITSDQYNKDIVTIPMINKMNDVNCMLFDISALKIAEVIKVTVKAHNFGSYGA